MHQVIYALVEASTEDTALACGKATFDRLVETGPDNAAIFDYYVTFDDERSSVAGEARWGELPVVEPVDSDDGTELLERGWQATRQEFERNLERVRTAEEDGKARVVTPARTPSQERAKVQVGTPTCNLTIIIVNGQ